MKDIEAMRLGLEHEKSEFMKNKILVSQAVDHLQHGENNAVLDKQFEQLAHALSKKVVPATRKPVVERRVELDAVEAGDVMSLGGHHADAMDTDAAVGIVN